MIANRKGQALVESLLVFIVLISFFIAIPWLGRLIDIGIQQENANRYTAFQWTRRMQQPDILQIKQQFFLSDANNWRDRFSQKIVSEDSIQIHADRHYQLSDDMQPGQQTPFATQLRKEWGVQDQGVVNIASMVTPHYVQHNGGENILGVDASFLERLSLTLHRHIAILIDAAHSVSDKDSHYRTGQSATAWKETAEQSYALGKHIQKYAAGAEGFDRAQPVFDWLVPWSDKLPQHHLREK